MATVLRLQAESYNRLIEKMRRLKKVVNPKSPAMKAALVRGAALIVATAKINVTRKKIIMDGLLRESIRQQFTSPDEGGQIAIAIGSFDTNYAALHEFGDKDFTQKQRRAMFWRIRQSGRYSPGVTKSVLQGNVFKAREFLHPAYRQHKRRVAVLIANAIEQGMKGK